MKKRTKSSVNYISKCGDTRCEICPMLICKSSIIVENGCTHTINNDMNCNSLNVIYLIICNCGLNYIGQTNNFRNRINLHKEQINI